MIWCHWLGNSLAKFQIEYEKRLDLRFTVVEPVVRGRSWFHKYPDFPRFMISKICHLRLNHTNLPKHSFQKKLSDTPFCPLHLNDQTECDVNHVLFCCPRFQREQEDLFEALIKLKTPLPTAGFLVSGNAIVLPFIYKIVLKLLANNVNI